MIKIIILLFCIFSAVSAIANSEYDQQYRQWKQKQLPVSYTKSTSSTLSNQNHHKVSINHSDQLTLQTLSGIGNKKAQAIIDYRVIHGPFKTINDLKNIKGISDKIIEKNKDRLVL